MQPADKQQLLINTNEEAWLPGLVRRLEMMPLHAFGSEHLAMVHWAPGTVFQPHGHPGGGVDPGPRWRIPGRTRHLSCWQLAAQPARQHEQAMKRRRLHDLG